LGVIEGREGVSEAVTLTPFVIRVTEHVKELGRDTIGHKKMLTPLPLREGVGGGAMPRDPGKK
jgi:hypothetical protein